MPVLYPAGRVFVLVQRIPGTTDGDATFNVLGVYSDERQVGDKARELNGASHSGDDDYVYYLPSHLIDPRQ